MVKSQSPIWSTQIHAIGTDSKMHWAKPLINLISRYIAVGADDSTVRVLDYNQATTFRIG